MTSIHALMTHDHRRCDDVFATVEQAVNAGQWSVASRCFAEFSEAVLHHFSLEETLLFPAFEARTGMRTGPTQVMRQEHAQMRELIASAAGRLAEQDAGEYSGEAETLLIMMQQHNMKEENVLYPMCDQHLSGEAGAALILQLQAAQQEVV